MVWVWAFNRSVEIFIGRYRNLLLLCQAGQELLIGSSSSSSQARVLFRVYIFDYIGHIQVILFNMHTKGEAEQRNIKEREKTLLNNMITGLVGN